MSKVEAALIGSSLTQHLHLIIQGAKRAIKELPRWERPAHLFWLLGPFILLIERSPADIWLSLLAIVFVVRSAWHRDIDWLRHDWVRASFLFFPRNAYFFYCVALFLIYKRAYE